MPQWTAHAARVESRWDSVRRAVKRRLGLQDPPRVQSYLGYGTPDRLFVKGRVLADARIGNDGTGSSAWKNLVAMLRRYESDEVPGARLRIAFDGHSEEVESDEEGYFDATLPVSFSVAQAERGWHTAAVELLQPVSDGAAPKAFEAQVLVPPPSAKIGIVSDIDDTIVKTGATDLLRHARTVLLNSARTRTPFAGVAPLYQGLARGGGDRPVNPIFYVSSSPWNLFDLFHEYMRYHEIPEGPIFLKDFGLERDRLFKSGHGEHKAAWIERLMELYPDLGWILIGDSGQKDAEIYSGIAERHPRRVRAIYIRDVASDGRGDDVRRMLGDMKAPDVATVVDADSRAAARHAAGEGWLSEQSLAAVEAAVREEQG